MNILLAGDWPDDERDAWADVLGAALAQSLPGRHRLLLQRGVVDDASITAAIVANPPSGSLAGLTHLQLIQSLWAGVDRLLADASLPADVTIARMVDPVMNAAMAETALWAVLSLHRGFFDCAQQQRSGLWQQAPQARADELALLVLGHGEMGRAVAQVLARQGYPVSTWSRQSSQKTLPGVRHRYGDAALLAAAAQACIVVNLLPLTAVTRGVLNAALFDALPRGASIVNLARGAHLVEADLLAALDSGRVHRAVLDVFAVEPLPNEHPFWRHPRVTVLPHIAAQTDLRSAADVAVANLHALAHGQAISHVVDRVRGY